MTLETNSNMNLQKKALGRLLLLGDLYDGLVSGHLIIQLRIGSECDHEDAYPVHFTDISYLICGSTSEKLHKLSVDAQLKLSLLSGLVLLEDTGKYLSKQNDKWSKSWSADLFYKKTTMREELDLAKLSADEINQNAFKLEATHVVVGIKWGVSMIGSFEREAMGVES